MGNTRSRQIRTHRIPTCQIQLVKWTNSPIQNLSNKRIRQSQLIEFPHPNLQGLEGGKHALQG